MRIEMWNIIETDNFTVLIVILKVNFLLDLFPLSFFTFISLFL